MSQDIGGENTQSFECQVDVAEAHQLGEFANAVRVMQDGSELLLDLLVYSSTEHRATVVGRFRVTPSLLVAIRDRIEASLPPSLGRGPQGTPI